MYFNFNLVEHQHLGLDSFGSKTVSHPRLCHHVPRLSLPTIRISKMVLAVGNAVVVKEPPSCLESFLASSARLREDVDAFKSLDVATISEEADSKYSSSNITLHTVQQ